MHRSTFLLLTLIAACADPIGSFDEPDGGLGDAGVADSATSSVPSVSGAFTHDDTGQGIASTVDATEVESWQYLDLDTGEATDDPGRWDVAFRRFFVGINGGVSGSGDVQVAYAEGNLAETQEPSTEYTTAVEDGDGDDDGEADTPFNNGVDDWYDYEVETHTLTAKVRTYFVTTTRGGEAKLQILDYYDSAGTPARVSFTWQLVREGTREPDGGTPDGGVDGGVVDAGGGDQGTLPTDAVTVDASLRSTWTYWAVEGSTLVSIDPEDPAGSGAWDLALRRTDVATNSGTSGPGFGGARSLGAVAYDEVHDVSTFGFARDAVVTSARPGSEPTSVNGVLNSWYDYNPTFHTVSPKDETYVLRTASGDYVKLRIWAWTDGVYQLSVAPIAFTTPVETLRVDASDAAAWTAISLEMGALVEEDGAWDVGASRTLWRTNGGVSGEGSAAAARVEGTIEGAFGLDGHMLTPDTTIEPSRPGASAYDGNEVLGDWFDYDSATRTVTTRGETFVLRTALGDCAALRIADWNDGIYTLELRYAGAGRNAFE